MPSLQFSFIFVWFDDSADHLPMPHILPP